jgi:hypothetical protein
VARNKAKIVFLTTLNQKGGAVKVYDLFGEALERLLSELNQKLTK